MSLDELLNNIRSEIASFIKIDINDIRLQKTNPEFVGDYTFVIPKNLFSQKDDLRQWLMLNSRYLSNCNIVKCFLNLSIKDGFLINCLGNFSLDYKVEKKQRIIVEYSSPNTNKPLHLGHLRNNFIGYAISAMLKTIGHDVFQVSLINDRGIHICKSMVAYKHFGNEAEPTNIKGDHFVGNYYVTFEKPPIDTFSREQLLSEAHEMLQKWEQSDPETLALWNKMNTWVYDGFNETYKMIGVTFDKVYYESKTYLLGKSIVNQYKDHFYTKDDGSIWVDLTDIGLDQKLLLRSDGTSVYVTQDLGTADLRYNDYKADKMIYVVGDEQEYHFAVLKGILKKIGKPYADNIYHLSYGMVDLPSGKMKSREGTVVDADDIIDEMIIKAKDKTDELNNTVASEQLCKTIALGALKFYILKVSCKKRMLFDPNKSISLQGDTGPFVQYTYVRTRSILKQFENEIKGTISPDITLDPTERNVMIAICEYHSKLLEAVKMYDPSIITQYVLKLARLYNQFYEQLPIKKETNLDKQNLRLLISKITGEVIKKCLSILGIDVPLKM